MKKIVVGGGPIGTYLASRSSETTIFEQKTQIGKPTQCTGLLSNQVEQLIDKKLLKTITTNIIRKTEINGPQKKVTLKLSPNYIIDNSLFEEKLADMALAKGNDIILNKRYGGSSGLKHLFKDLKTKKISTIKSQELIGIDGPRSKVGETHHFSKQQQYIGMQARIKVKEHQNTIKFYPHLGVYAWYVPETTTTARVGIVLSKQSQSTFNTFLKRFPGKIIERQGGLIPLHKPHKQTIKQTKTHRVVLLGDAAGHIKNTTGGGLIPGMIAAKQYSALNEEYRGTPRGLRRELYGHFLVHNLLQQANHKEWDKIITRAQKYSELLEKTNRDETRKMMLKLGLDRTFLAYGLSKVISGKVKLF